MMTACKKLSRRRRALHEKKYLDITRRHGAYVRKLSNSKPDAILVIHQLVFQRTDNSLESLEDIEFIIVSD